MRGESRPRMMKPMIASLERSTSQDTKTPPDTGIAWLPPPFVSHDPNPVAVLGRHLMRIESNDNGGSESEEIREELTIRDMGIIVPRTYKRERESQQ